MLKNKLSNLDTKQKLMLITLLGGLIRIAFIGSYPSKLNVDEAAKGYNAFSLIKTGKTFRGLTWPLYFTDFDVDQPSTAIIYNYLVVPSVYIFGLTKTAVRLPAAIIGTLSIPALYYLTYLIYKNKSVALLAALILCLSPWHIYLSRWGVEPVTYPAFFISALALLIKGLESGIWRVLGSFVLGIAMYTYPSALLIIPIFFALFIYTTKNYWLKSKKYSLLGLLAYILAISPLIYLYSTNTLMYGRFNSVSVFTFFDTKKALVIFFLQLIETIPLLIFLYPLPLVLHLLKGLADSFFKKASNCQIERLLAITFVISAIPANLTFSPDRITVLFIRGSALIGLSEIIISYNIIKNKETLTNHIYKKTLLASLTMSYITMLWSYDYIYVSGRNYYRDYGFEKAHSYMAQIDNKYKNVIVDLPDTQSFIYLLFYYKYAPDKFINANKVWVKREPYGVQTLANFDKYYFCNIQCPEPKGSTLILTTPNRHLNLNEIYSLYEKGKKILSIRER